ncbi:MAG: hypothetical protein RIR33_2613 [Pseudomonadota bacterium]|jgi:DNA-binding response OmpR family regulator
MTTLFALVVGCPPEFRNKLEFILEPYGFECILLERATEALEYAQDIIALVVICLDEGQMGCELETLVREGHFGADPPPIIRVYAHAVP